MGLILNYWWVTRPKRRLDSVVDVLATCAENFLDQEWQGQLGTQLSVEEALEASGLKRVGERRDRQGGRGGGGARTYLAWLTSLGFVFVHEATKQIKLTLAGEALLSGGSPVEILKNQILKYQFPSPFSLAPRSSKVRVNPRFRIRPFRFLLRLLNDERIQHLTIEEIAKIVVTEAENETRACYEHVVSRILLHRDVGDLCLADDFFKQYASSLGRVNPDHPFSHLMDLADTIIDWLEYTQLITCERNPKVIRILDPKRDEVNEILAEVPPFIPYPENRESFQRRYGLDPNHIRDNRNFAGTQTITARMILERRIQRAYLSEATEMPITTVTTDLVDRISEQTGIEQRFVEEVLDRLYPRGSVGIFLDGYFHKAFSGREEAAAFETATVQIFSEVFGFQARHVGPIGLTPDVLILSDQEGYQAIVDNKAYERYSISNDHYNRMVHNYIGNIGNYSHSSHPLAFFSYIAGGFCSNIEDQLRQIVAATHVNGSAMPVSNLIRMIEIHNANRYNHSRIRDIFSINRQILISDL